ncbi:NifB/NifX family molybdenum-iron cluster-binding protein [Agaribacterium haliotis]|uniref:NifB/NifX family molybdenum-iron cluster-binding protein n=1 Tax=Agaribacterium haliotis TaxID=2013869 RepID=UPI000BB58C56|nr:NifB/NifX family molybdenum-iron cluster-binding protein [Agaribacterium haliotis]
MQGTITIEENLTLGQSQKGSEQSGVGFCIVFASANGICVDQHFGSAKALFRFSLSKTGFYQTDCKYFGSEKHDGNENKLIAKLKWAEGADLLYCRAIGPSAVKQLMALGARPISLSENQPVEKLLAQLQRQLINKSETWLNTLFIKKQREHQGKLRFDTYDNECW